MVVLLLSPVFVIFAAPLAIGIGLDIFEVAGKAAMVAVLAGPVAAVLLGRLLRAPARHLVAAWLRPPLPLGQASRLDYAP
jgi:hypothetical protein